MNVGSRGRIDWRAGKPVKEAMVVKVGRDVWGRQTKWLKEWPNNGKTSRGREVNQGRRGITVWMTGKPVSKIMSLKVGRNIWGKLVDMAKKWPKCWLEKTKTGWKNQLK